ncbi:glycerophosphodiester phosphodiesterase [Halalkalicoccus jeotgali]|uniref:Glycerophosphoryl diester phosphodiesterase n=1 Tax=Halalkalicoccus jeotgali (strain DSM 18796 / CECT 7217 / JCM 14584 / KCTC 4019 / B3) TaxID=795797 RepID=D8J3Z8_HALJB|nr:glycerophosphodiester phosphodiesterase [Halalkalicoccus jeotgali]ADJ15390.1 glycerophosphoryl diester phosphodiesterase [Halalkalicoccus jeotgali B3]ELY35834.1 glycerophosphoryl diester phosphodiesterase [Halalkalicoccus jeotgali B3]
MKDTTSSGVDRRTVIKGAGAALGISAIASTGVSASDETTDGTDDSDSGTPATIAHRAYAGMAPENTLGAVEAATDTADMIEIDIVPTADGTVVVFHDDRLDGRDGGAKGLTDAEGYVWERPWEVVREAEVLESGETVPSLEAVLEAIPPEIGVNIEFKNPGTTEIRTGEKLCASDLAVQKDLWRPMAERALDLATAVDNEILVSSFAEAALAVTREIDPDVSVAFLFWDAIEPGLEITETYDCEALHPPWNLVKGTPFYGDDYTAPGPYESDVDLIEWSHDRGKEINVYTIQSWYPANQLAAAGVDGLITDFPDPLW